MKRALDRGITLLIVTNLLVVAGLLVAVLVGRINAEPPGHPEQEVPSPSGDIALMSMGPAHIPTSSSCLLCHETGGEAGLKPEPALGHPLEGWRQCAACHTGERLGQTAPGHEGIPEEECLNCHVEAPVGPAITQPHSELQDQNCLDCHGDYVHLPDEPRRPQPDRVLALPQAAGAAAAELPPRARHAPHLPQLPPVRAGGRAADGPRPARRHDLPALPRDPAGVATARRTRHPGDHAGARGGLIAGPPVGGRAARSPGGTRDAR